ncbi:YfaZ family outer membrane protein [Marinomonas epiphytica]
MANLYKALVLGVGVLGASFTYASNASINMTNDRINGNANINLGSFTASAGGTYDEDADASTFYVGLGVEDSEGGSGPLQAGIGTRFYVIDTNTEDDDNDLALALGLGGWYRYTLPQANRLSIYGSAYYSPEILSITNLHHTYTYELRGEYMTMRNARAFIRYGKTVIVFDDGGHKELNTGLSVGASVDF